MKRAPILIPSIRPHRFRKRNAANFQDKEKISQSLKTEDLQKINSTVQSWNETHHSIGENRNLKSA